MKISYSWIKDFLDINLTIDEVAETLTMLGLEAEISTNFDELNEINYYYKNALKLKNKLNEVIALNPKLLSNKF